MRRRFGKIIHQLAKKDENKTQPDRNHERLEDDNN